MGKSKLLVVGLLAGIVAIAGFILSFASFESSSNVLGLDLNNADISLGGITAFAAQPHAVIPSASGLAFTDTVTSTLDVTNSQKIAIDIAKYFSGTVTVTQVISLRNAGWGYGEIFKLYELAKESNKSPAVIMAMRAAGMGWGEIARSLDVAPGNKGANLGAAVSGRGAAGTQNATAGTVANPGDSGPGFSGKNKGNNGLGNSKNSPPGKAKGR